MEEGIGFAEKHPELHTVILSMAGPMYIHEESDALEGLSVLELMDKPGTKEQSDIFETAMRRTLDRLIKADKNVIFVLNIPVLPFGPLVCLPPRPFQITKKFDEKRKQCADSKSSFEKKNRKYRELINKVLKDYPQVALFDSSAVFCDDKLCYAMKGKEMFYRDNGHLSLAGSRHVAQYLAPFIEKKIEEKFKNKNISK